MPGLGWLEAGGCHLETEEEGEREQEEDDEGAHSSQQHRARARPSRVSCNTRVERETNLREEGEWWRPLLGPFLLTHLRHYAKQRS